MSPYLMHIPLQSRYVNVRNKGDLVDDVAVSGNFSEFFGQDVQDWRDLFLATEGTEDSENFFVTDENG